jgi:hypothetical protein
MHETPDSQSTVVEANPVYEAPDSQSVIVEANPANMKSQIARV